MLPANLLQLGQILRNPLKNNCLHAYLDSARSSMSVSGYMQEPVNSLALAFRGFDALLSQLAVNHLNPIRNRKLKLLIGDGHILPLISKAIFRDRSVHFLY